MDALVKRSTILLSAKSFEKNSLQFRASLDFLLLAHPAPAPARAPQARQARLVVPQRGVVKRAYVEPLAQLALGLASQRADP